MAFFQMGFPRYLFVSIVFICTLASCGPPRITFFQVSNASLTVGPDWVELSPVQPPTADWDEQEVKVSVPDNRFNLNLNPLGLKREDGVILIPEVDATTAQGTLQRFRFDGLSGPDDLTFASDKIPRGTRFVRLRIRCSALITISKVTWISYMPEDTKAGVP